MSTKSLSDEDRDMIMAIIEEHQIPGDGGVMDSVSLELWEYIERQVQEACARLADENCETVTHQDCGDAIRARSSK